GVRLPRRPAPRRGADARRHRRGGSGHNARYGRCALGGHSGRTPRLRLGCRASRQRRATTCLHRGIARASRGKDACMTDDSYERGLQIRREVLGDEHVDRALEQTVDETRDFQDFITRYAWGEIWARPGLDRRVRSCITLTALVAQGRFDELELHIAAARRNGLTDTEISEVLLQTAVYCGGPAANSAFRVFRRVLDSRESGGRRAPWSAPAPRD